ncbi:hypothetical protein PMI01_02749 [Caulobacter sp. AP07]|uniref:hypothetical protein n=1 Tax=Caulobacter sp. AP07 TaxID=1144304 RepID=UPI0002721636|nr:hypothetical protein [Caulobacter sp. AP07]EJL31587.1 hypothetical protein PMI01_02749 [Caulobacter sp. AP07]
MTSNNRRGLLDYWTHNTNGYLDLVGSEMFPVVNITLGAADRDRDSHGAFVNRIGRLALAHKAIDATKAFAGRDLAEFGGFYIHVFPGTPLVLPDPSSPSGQLSIALDLGSGMIDGRRFCAIPDQMTGHLLMAHELGHVVGFPDSFGILSSGIDWNNTGATSHLYGDPYDIMSASTFATLNNPAGGVFYAGDPTFSGPVPADWRPGGTSAMGPALTQASLHKIYPNAIPPGVIRYVSLPLAGPVTARLYASQSRGGAKRLIIVRPQNEDVSGRGRCYIEFRDSIAWDQGLKTSGGNLSRRGVTAHVLADEPGVGVRAFYRGRVLVPVETDSDLRVAFTTLTVRVLRTDLHLGYVDIELSQSANRGVSIEAASRVERVAPIGPQIERFTPCGDTIHYGAWRTRTITSYEGLAFGFGGTGGPLDPPVTFHWTVGGQPLDPAKTRVDIAVGGSVHKVSYALTPSANRLLLTSAPGDHVEAPVRLTVTDQSDSATAEASFTAQGVASGYSPHDIGVLGACEAKLRLRLRWNLGDFTIPGNGDLFPEPPPEFADRSVLETEIAAAVTAGSDLADHLRSLLHLRFDTAHG